MVRTDSWKDYEVRPVLPVRCRLGEGCVWDRQSGRLYFVDIEGCKIYGFCPGRETEEIWEFDTDDMVGCLVPCEDGIVAAVGHRLIRITDVGKGNRADVLMELPLPDYVRFNDGKCDARGRFWVGTMAVSQEHPKAKGCGSLYCIEEDRVLAEYAGYTIPNGMAWDGEDFYHIDTSKGAIEKYRMGAAGRLFARCMVVDVASSIGRPAGVSIGAEGRPVGVRVGVEGRPSDVSIGSEGMPDGMCIDSEGKLWTAMWGGGKVNCYDPATGQKLTEIAVPADNVSCVAFGDEDLKTLYITTAMNEKGLGGQLYAVRLPVAGVEPYRYGGRKI